MALNSSKLLILFTLLIITSTSTRALEAEEYLLLDDDEFGLIGGTKSPDLDPSPLTSPPPPPPIRKRSSDPVSDSKVQFTLEHAFGDSDFSPAGTFSARLKLWSHGGQTLTKLRFSRDDFTGEDKAKFTKLVEDDDFYRIRLPSNVISPPGRDYIISSVRARCLPRNGLDELFVIHMDGAHVLAVNYGSPGACQYPRPLKVPSKWAFTSHTVLKNSEQAPRTPAFSEDIGGVEVGGEDEGVKPLERSFWAKYWMYLIPLGLIVMNAVTQAMNMPEEQAGAQPGSQTQQPIGAVPRGPSTTVRRR